MEKKKWLLALKYKNSTVQDKADQKAKMNYSVWHCNTEPP